MWPQRQRQPLSGLLLVHPVLWLQGLSRQPLLLLQHVRHCVVSRVAAGVHWPMRLAVHAGGRALCVCVGDHGQMVPFLWAIDCLSLLCGSLTLELAAGHAFMHLCV